LKDKKAHKLLLISPTGEKYQVGFLSPCRDGIVLGTSQIKKVDSAHLTIIRKKGEILAHITPQQPSAERRWFPPTSVRDVTARFLSLVEKKLVFQLSSAQLSEEVLYVTEKFRDWFDALIGALYQERSSKKEILHILNFKSLIEQIPKFIEELRESPESFFGLCKAGDILKNKAIVAGFSSSKLLIIPLENELIGVDFGVFTNFDFIPSINQSEISNPLAEFYKNIGIPQYFKEEIMEKKFLEKLLSKESHHQN